MATAPKAVAKAAPVTALKAGAEEAPVAKKSKKKLILLLLIISILLIGGGGSAWYFMGRSAPAPGTAAEVKKEPEKPPVFVALEPFTVNLQPDTGGEQFLQVALTLQVTEQTQVDLLKLHMPQLRSRMLLLLSGKKASEISTVDGKKKLVEEIIAQVKQPYSAQGKSAAVSDVFFTSFVIQ